MVAKCCERFYVNNMPRMCFQVKLSYRLQVCGIQVQLHLINTPRNSQHVNTKQGNAKCSYLPFCEELANYFSWVIALLV